MIDPIHNQAYQEYTKINRQKPLQTTDEKFSMDSSLSGNPLDQNAGDGVIYEPGNKDEKDASKAVATGSGKDNSPYSASSRKNTAITPSAQTAENNAKTTASILDTVRELFQNMLARLKKVLAFIWESKPVSDETDTTAFTDISTDTSESDTKVLDQDIKNALKSGDTDTFRALLSDDGRRIPARNSSLLTYYDSKGRLITPDPSDQYRILHGDRGSRKS